jgi:hypothetical protein
MRIFASKYSYDLIAHGPSQGRWCYENATKTPGVAILLSRHCKGCASVRGPNLLAVRREQNWLSNKQVNYYTNRTPAPKHAPHQSTLKRVPLTTTKCAIYTPNRFVLTRQWLQFKEGTLYTLAMLWITTSAAILPCHDVLKVSLN